MSERQYDKPTADQLRAAGLMGEPDETDGARAFREQQETELATRGKPHGLTADEVAAADATGMPLQRYAALKGVNTLYGYQDVERNANIRQEAQRQADIEAARRQLQQW